MGIMLIFQKSTLITKAAWYQDFINHDRVSVYRLLIKERASTVWWVLDRSSA